MTILDVRFLPHEEALDVAIVVDVLRMTTTAAAMLAAGAADIVIVAGVPEARAEAERRGALLFGERGGVALPGFDGGNSPLELGELAITARTAVVCTTNGSKAVVASDAAAHVLLGSIVNAPAVAARAVALAHTGITVVCAGTEGRVSLDDVLAAGCIVHELIAGGADLELSDAARIAAAVADASPDLRAGLSRARHGRVLLDLGFERDLDYAAERGSVAVVPERRDRTPATFVTAPAV